MWASRGRRSTTYRAGWGRVVGIQTTIDMGLELVPDPSGTWLLWWPFNQAQPSAVAAVLQRRRCPTESLVRCNGAAKPNPFPPPSWGIPASGQLRREGIQPGACHLPVP